jgi:hypothetical protein
MFQRQLCCAYIRFRAIQKYGRMIRLLSQRAEEKVCAVNAVRK